MFWIFVTVVIVRMRQLLLSLLSGFVLQDNFETDHLLHLSKLTHF